MTNSSRKRDRGRRRWLWWGAGTLVVLGLAAATYGLLSPDEEPAAAPAEFPLRLAPYEVTIAGPGSLAAGHSLEVGFGRGLSGTLHSVATVGQRMTAGQEVAALEPEPFERALRDAEFALTRAQTALSNLQANQANSRASMSREAQDAESRLALAEREHTRTSRDLELIARLVELGTESQAAGRAAQEAFDDADAELRAADSALANLTRTQERQRQIQSGELRDAELSLTQAQLGLADATGDLAALSATAPITGAVSGVHAVTGARVTDGQALLTLIDDATLELVVQIDETEINSVALGQPARLTFDALPGEEYLGVVSAVAPVGRIESNIPIFDVTVSLENVGGRLRPGMTAEAAIVIQEEAVTATVPSSALIPSAGQQLLQVRTREGAVEAVPVTVIHTVGFNSVVVGDLQEGATVVLPSGTDLGPAGQGRVQQQGSGIGMPSGLGLPRAPAGRR